MSNAKVSLNVYVAGKWSAKRSMRVYMNDIQTYGHHIVHDWTRVETQSSPTTQKLQKDAIADINGVKKSDVLIAVFTDETYSYRGTFTEIGCALGQNKPVIIFCPYPQYTNSMNVCFAHHPLVQVFTNWESLVIYLNQGYSL